MLSPASELANVRALALLPPYIVDDVIRNGGAARPFAGVRVRTFQTGFGDRGRGIEKRLHAFPFCAARLGPQAIRRVRKLGECGQPPCGGLFCGCIRLRRSEDGIDAAREKRLGPRDQGCQPICRIVLFPEGQDLST